jgi:ATP-dependent phosphofructokinase / diphosphate-dependent phosphofructokinase
MKKIERIGILTSGGDCAGLNAVIRAVVLHAAGQHGWEVIGIRNGTQGLMDRPVAAMPLAPAMVGDALLRQAGTILGTTNRGNPFAYPMPDGSVLDRTDEAIEGYRMLGLDALIGVGGDGSIKILRDLTRRGGIPLVAIPKTIDNDVMFTEFSVGFETAMSTATLALDHLQPTAASHSRVMVLEVMGRDAGHIAVTAGIAGGADVIVIPEIPYRLERIAAHIAGLRDRGRNFALVVVAEAVPMENGAPLKAAQSAGGQTYGGIGHYLGARIGEVTGAETRVTVLGHVQRGGVPEPRDRILASAFGVHAVDLIAARKFDRMVAWRNRTVVDIAIDEVVAKPRSVDPDGTLVRTARGLGISFGD